jgi:hypothetical protein
MCTEIIDLLNWRAATLMHNSGIQKVDSALQQ